MKHISFALAIIMVLFTVLAGCGNMQQVPPTPNGPQAWGKEEPYSTLRNATIKGAATGQWLAKKYEKLDWRTMEKTMTKAEYEAIIAAGYDVWTGTFKQTSAGVTPYKVEQLAIGDSLSLGKTFDGKGKEVPLKCLVSTGAGIFRELIKKEKSEHTSPFANLGGTKREYIERDASHVIITACARQDVKGAWAISHVTVEKPKKTEGGN